MALRMDAEGGKGKRMEGVRLRNQAAGGQPAGRRGISGSTVKMVAVAVMLIDHIAAAVLTRQIMANGFLDVIGGTQGQIMGWLTENGALYYGMQGMRMIGRLGFPIFCFLLVEGFQRSRDVRQYALRLGVFALISEIPFDLAITGRLFHGGYQNVYFTLLLGLLAMCGYGYFDKCRQGLCRELPGVLRMFLTITGGLLPAFFTMMFMDVKLEGSARAVTAGVVCAVAAVLILALYGRKKGFRHVQAICADITVLAVMMLLAEWLCTDYGGMGVLTITVMYIFRKSRVAAMLAGCTVLTVMSVGELPAFLAAVPVALYNGKRGMKMKYFFYVFYPLHLFLLYVVSVLLGLGDIVLL